MLRARHVEEGENLGVKNYFLGYAKVYKAYLSINADKYLILFQEAKYLLTTFFIKKYKRKTSK